MVMVEKTDMTGEMDKINKTVQAERLKTAILKLDTFPQSHQKRLEGRYAEKGYRQLIIDNYIAVFRIDEDTKTVTVVTVQYHKREF